MDINQINGDVLLISQFTLFAQTKKLPEECVEAVLDAKKIADKTSKVVFDTHTKHGGWKGQNMGQIKADVTCLLHGNYLLI